MIKKYMLFLEIYVYVCHSHLSDSSAMRQIVSHNLTFPLQYSSQMITIIFSTQFFHLVRFSHYLIKIDIKS